MHQLNSARDTGTNASTIVCPPLQTVTSAVWSIDAVLMPIIPKAKTVGELLKVSPAPIFTAALQAAGLFSSITGTSFKGTVFVPSEQVGSGAAVIAGCAGGRT